MGRKKGSKNRPGTKKVGRKKGTKNKVRNYNYFYDLSERANGMKDKEHINESLKELASVESYYKASLEDIIDIYKDTEMDKNRNLTSSYFQILRAQSYATRLRNVLGARAFNELLAKYNITLEYLTDNNHWSNKGYELHLPNMTVLEIHYEYLAGHVLIENTVGAL